MGVLADPLHQVEGCGGPLGDPGHDVGGSARSPRRRGRRQVEVQQPRTDDRAEPVMEVAAAHRADRDVAVVAEVAEHLGEDRQRVGAEEARGVGDRGEEQPTTVAVEVGPEEQVELVEAEQHLPAGEGVVGEGLQQELARALARRPDERAEASWPHGPGAAEDGEGPRHDDGRGEPAVAQHHGQQVGVTVGTVEEGRAVVGLGRLAVANPGRQSTRELGQHAEGGRHHVVILEVGDHDPRQPVDDRGEALRAELVQEQAPGRGVGQHRGQDLAEARGVVGVRQQLGVEVEQQRHELVDPRERVEGGGGTVVRIVHHGPGRAGSPMVEGDGVADRDGPVGRVEGARHDGGQARLPGRHHTDGPAPALGRVARLGLPAAHRRGLGDRRGESPSQRQDALGVVAEEAAHRSGTGERPCRQGQALELAGLVVESHGGAAQAVHGLVDQAVDGPAVLEEGGRGRPVPGVVASLASQRTQLGPLHHGCEAAQRPRSALQLPGLHDRIHPSSPPEGRPPSGGDVCLSGRGSEGRATDP